MADDEAEMLCPVAVRMLWPQVMETPTRSGLYNESILLPSIASCPEVGWLQGWLILHGSMTLSRTQISLLCHLLWVDFHLRLCPHGHKMVARVPDIP